jgi:hypothetical protein
VSLSIARLVLKYLRKLFCIDVCSAPSFNLNSATSFKESKLEATGIALTSLIRIFGIEVIALA